MWNDEIKQNIIKELNEQFDSISSITPIENHSYSDSIFSPSTISMCKPIEVEVYGVPNYYEKTINSTRTIKEIPVHTLAFADSFNSADQPKIGFAYGSGFSSYGMPNQYTGYDSGAYSNDVRSNKEVTYDMETIIHNPGAITFSISPEQRRVAITKRATWKEILFEDASLIRNTEFVAAIKRFCNIQIKI